MNAEVEQELMALAGGDNAQAGAEATPDYKALYEETQRKLQTEKVEEGRLKKANEEIAAMKRELAELKASRRTEEIANAIPEDLRNANADETVSLTAAAARAAADGVRREFNERFAQMEQQRQTEAAAGAKARWSEFVKRVEARYPGVLASLSPNGDKRKAWNEYLKFNGASVQQALSSFDDVAFGYHVDSFYRTVLDLPVPSGDSGAPAAPDPGMASGGAAAPARIEPGKTYSQEEIAALYDKADEALREGRESEHDRIAKEIETAYQEGRVKQ